ncbi:MAG: hypothetical protein ACYC1D_11130 [Acidimicrobiales bacterium]
MIKFDRAGVGGGPVADIALSALIGPRHLIASGPASPYHLGISIGGDAAKPFFTFSDSLRRYGNLEESKSVFTGAYNPVPPSPTQRWYFHLPLSS